MSKPSGGVGSGSRPPPASSATRHAERPSPAGATGLRRSWIAGFAMRSLLGSGGDAFPAARAPTSGMSESCLVAQRAHWSCGPRPPSDPIRRRARAPWAGRPSGGLGVAHTGGIARAGGARAVRGVGTPRRGALGAARLREVAGVRGRRAGRPRRAERHVPGRAPGGRGRLGGRARELGPRDRDRDRTGVARRGEPARPSGRRGVLASGEPRVAPRDREVWGRARARARPRRPAAHPVPRGGARVTYAEWAPPPWIAEPAACMWSTLATGRGGGPPPAGADPLQIEGRGTFVAGPDTHPAPPATGPVAGLRVRPGHAAAVLGVPATELRDSRVAIEDLWGRER